MATSPKVEVILNNIMANKFNHFKLWLYNRLGLGWSAHWAQDGELLAVYYLPTIVRYGVSAPNTVLQAEKSQSPVSEVDSGELDYPF
jgi:hypothetical protein